MTMNTSEDSFGVEKEMFYTMILIKLCTEIAPPDTRRIIYIHRHRTNLSTKTHISRS